MVSHTYLESDLMLGYVRCNRPDPQAKLSTQNSTSAGHRFTPTVCQHGGGAAVLNSWRLVAGECWSLLWFYSGSGWKQRRVGSVTVRYGERTDVADVWSTPTAQ